MYNRIEEFFKDRYKDWEGSGQFEGTGERIKRLIDEMCWTPSKIDEELDKCFEKRFEEAYSEMLVSSPTIVWTLCPHHILPCRFEVCIGYIPGKDRSVLGLSKFSRIAVILGKRPIMQETYTREVADVIEERLIPMGLGIWVIGRHGCMEVRGVQQEASVSTSVLRGEFMGDSKVREEFYSIARSMKEGSK